MCNFIGEVLSKQFVSSSASESSEESAEIPSPVPATDTALHDEAKVTDSEDSELVAEASSVQDAALLLFLDEADDFEVGFFK